MKSLEGGFMLTTPVVFNFFIRPEVSIQTFQKIKNVRPSTLYLISDGPRNDKEQSLIKSNRVQIESMIDWDCNLELIYFSENQGIDKIMEITYERVFQKEDRMIFLEEDILADESFFFFTENLLEYYKDNDRVYIITGMNKLNQYPENQDPSYFFQEFNSTWGFAIWKRTYEKFQKNLSFLDSKYYENLIKHRFIKYHGIDPFQHLMFKKTYPEKDILDGEFYLILFNEFLLNNSLAIVPCRNLTLHIGNTLNSEHSDPEKLLPKSVRTATRDIYPIDYQNIIHPKFLIADDNYSFLIKQKYHQSGMKMFIDKIERAFRILIFGGPKYFVSKTYNFTKRYISTIYFKRKFK